MITDCVFTFLKKYNIFMELLKNESNFLKSEKQQQNKKNCQKFLNF